MKIPDIHVSNVSVEENIFVDELNLLELILSSLVSQYSEIDVNISELYERFVIPVDGDTKADILSKLHGEHKLLPIDIQNTIAEILSSSPPESATLNEKTITVAADANDTVVSSFSQIEDYTMTKATFEIEQNAAVEEGTDQVVLAAGFYLPRPSTASRATIMTRSIESTVRKVIDRMERNNEGVYPALAGVMESTYNVETTNLGKLLGTFYAFFVDVTKESTGLRWSFVYPKIASGGAVTYTSEPLAVPPTISANVRVTVNADYLGRPGIFELTFTDSTTGVSYNATVSTSTTGAVPFDAPGTPFVVINTGDKVSFKDLRRMYDPPDPTPTPSPTVTITHPTPTPTISISPTMTAYPTPTPTITITPTQTITGSPDITSLFVITQNGDDVVVSLNTTQMSIQNTTEDIAGFTVAFTVPDGLNMSSGDGRVVLTSPFDKFQYRYATSNNTSNVLYVTGYCSFTNGSNEIQVDRNVDFINLLRITNVNDADVSPVNPSYNNVVAISNKAAKLWNLGIPYVSTVRTGFYVSDMTETEIMLTVDGNVFGEDANSFSLTLEGIVISSVSDSAEFSGWTVSVKEGGDGITATKTPGIAAMKKGDLRRLKLAYAEIKGDIKIKQALVNQKAIESGYLIPEDVHFDNGVARIRTKHLKDTLLKSFLVITKGDLGTVEPPITLSGWTVEAKYSTRDMYTRVLGYSTTSTPVQFNDGDALFTYTNVIRTQRVASQFPGYAFINALNTNIATMANVLTTEDNVSRFTWMLDHIADKTKIPTGESLGEFIIKSDVTFDGRILVNDVVALKQYILGALEYPSERPLAVFEVSYKISGVNDTIFNTLSGKLQEIGDAIETGLYGVNAKNVTVIGTEKTLDGDMIIYARVFWADASVLGGAIGKAGDMFQTVSYGVYSISPVEKRPSGVLAVVHKGGNTFTVYGNDLSEVSYTTYYVETSTAVPVSGYQRDITLADGTLNSDFDVLYVSGGGRTVATVVSGIAETPSPTITQSIYPTPTMTTSMSPTPTITQSIYPTPTMTGTPSASMSYIPPDNPPSEPSGYDYYVRIVKNTVVNNGNTYGYHAIEMKSMKSDIEIFGLDFILNEKARTSWGYNEFVDLGLQGRNNLEQLTYTSANLSSGNYSFVGSSTNSVSVPKGVYTSILRFFDCTDSVAFAEEDLQFSVSSIENAKIAYTPGVSQAQINATPTMTFSSTPTPTMTTSLSPTPTMTDTPSASMSYIPPDNPPSEPSGYDYYVRIVKNTVVNNGNTYGYHAIEMKSMKSDIEIFGLDFILNEKARTSWGYNEFVDLGLQGRNNLEQLTYTSANLSSGNYSFVGSSTNSVSVPKGVYTSILRFFDCTDSVAFAEEDLQFSVSSIENAKIAYTPGVSQMQASRVINSLMYNQTTPKGSVSNPWDLTTNYKNSGDVNDSGVVDISDAVYIQQYLAQVSGINASNVNKYGDVNDSGVVDISDAVYIQQYLAQVPNILLQGPPVSSVPDSSTRPTFIIKEVVSADGWTRFKVSIDVSTLNPYEFYEGNTTTERSKASVERDGDDETTYLESNSGDDRYQLIRSIELVMKTHVYVNTDINNDNVIQIHPPQLQNTLGPVYDKMYIYCARTAVNNNNETRIMIVNAHNKIESSEIECQQTFYINGTHTIDAIKGYIDWSKSYIGTTSIYKAGWNPLIGTDSAYELVKYDSAGSENTIGDYYWKKKSAAVRPDSTSSYGLFLRYSIDDGTNIIPGGVSNESFTSPAGIGGARFMVDFGNVEDAFGNVDGNIEY
jgi:hypothetical protein